MATPKQAGQSLRRVAKSLEQLPDEAVREAAVEVVREAQKRGGTFLHGKWKLGAKVKKGKKPGFVFVVGDPAGFWAIKSYGRRKSVARGRALGFDGGAFHSKTSKAVPSGNKSWDRVVEFAEDTSPQVIAAQVHKALR